MPICSLDIPAGIARSAKLQMVRKMSSALEAAYHFGDVRVFINEFAPENAGQDGAVGTAPVRPVCRLAVPAVRNLEVRRTLAAELNAAIVEAGGSLINGDEVMIFFDEYPLECVSNGRGRLGVDVAEITHAVEALNA